MNKLQADQTWLLNDEQPVTFSEAELFANTDKVVAYATATGRAVVADAEGRPLLTISVPTVDLPTLGDRSR